MSALGRNRTLNKNLTQLNLLTNLTDSCVPSRVIRQRQLYGDQYEIKFALNRLHGFQYQYFQLYKQSFLPLMKFR
jgi:hypothetical protein